MRITSGFLKGRLLKVDADAEHLRPTAERVREAIFSSLCSVVELSDVVVLDVYAGTGSLGLEALSRGARKAVFVEQHRQTAERLRRTIREFGLERCSGVTCADALKYLSVSRPATSEPFGLVLADPPYDQHPGMELASILERGGWIVEGSIFVVESSSREELAPDRDAEADRRLFPRLLKDKVYGDTRVSYFVFEPRPHRS
jgi:16S rRNA (guanine966-N2)-methyltransferase